MDRLNQMRSEASGSGDSSFNTSSLPNESYLTANDSSKYFSLLEDESSFNISKDSVSPEQNASVTDSEITSNLSPIPKKSDLDSYKIGDQIDAANILSGGVNIFDDNENSYDGDELVIDDNAAIVDEKTTSDNKDIDDIEINKIQNNLGETIEDVDPVIPSKDTEVVLQIDGKNVDAINIGNGLYLYRKDGEEELAAVQIIDDDQQHSSFKFLKVRENSEGNLEVYEEIEIEVPKDVPMKEAKPAENMAQVSLQDVDNNLNESNNTDKKLLTPQKDFLLSETRTMEFNKELQSESKKEVNLNGKMIKFSESRKSPVVGSFTPMTFHSTPNKEGIPLTKIMVDQHLHPSRCSDNTKKTIEVHTDSSKQRDITVKNCKEVLETKMDIGVKDCKELSIETEEKQKHSEEKDFNVHESMNVKNSNCEEVKDNADGCTEVDNFNQVSDSVTHTELNLNKTVKTVVDKPNSYIHDNKIDLSSIDCELQTKATNNKQILESSETVDSSINVQEVVQNDVAFSKVDLNKENSNKMLACTPVTVTSSQEITDSNLNNVDKVKEDNEFIPNESEEARNNMLSSSNETPGTKDNEMNNCKPKTESLNNKQVEYANKKLTPYQQKELQISLLNNEINLNENQGELQSKEVIKLSDEECVELNTNLNSKNLGNVNDDALKTNIGNEMITKHNNDQDKSKIDETVKVSAKDTSLDSIVCTDPVERKEEVDKSLIMNKIQSCIKDETEKTLPKINNDMNTKNVNVKPVNNNNTAVPFGKWTEANRQEFLNKIKEAKVPSNTSNTKQIKQANDLNRRDILQKIDSQRQQHSNNAISKVQEQQKSKSKVEPSAFIKSAIKHDTKIPVKERPTMKSKPICTKKNMNETSKNHPIELSNMTMPNVNKKESLQRREINNQDLIDKTIEDIINRVPPVVKGSKEERKQKVQNIEGVEKQKGMTLFGPSYHAKNEQSVTLDEIEMKMNELHGIPFVERPAHELPQKFIVDALHLKTESHKSTSNQSKISTPSQMSIVLLQTSQQQTTSEVVVNIDSDEEIIEHEPITGDVNLKKKSTEVVEKAQALDISQTEKVIEPLKKDVIITEKDFDKFFRRNSVTYENCLTVNFDGKEPHNVVQTVVEKDVAPKKLTRNEVLLAESKAKSTHKLQMLQARQNTNPSKIPTSAKYQPPEEENYGKNYQSKLQIAYQSALTAKRQKESPITIIEEKPVKVVYMDSNVDFIPCQLNVQGEKLSSVKQIASDLETFTHSTTDSLDSDIIENYDNNKAHDEAKTKSKHQRKQVLTPVETVDMELIEPNDLGIDMSPKKKRKIEEKPEKSPRNHVPKKSYLLGRTNIDDKMKAQDADKVSFKEITNHNSFVGHSNPITAIDNLVKAAELLETQAESKSNCNKTVDSDAQQNTPVKRGRGRPRKYPLPDAEEKKVKAPSPQKKPRLIDAKVNKRRETDEDDTSEDEIIKENWTIGKINENIVCPICGKLFRSENVVFKHVKHCTGPSPNRSESDKRRLRESRDSDQSILDFDESAAKKKRKFKESVSKSSAYSDEVVVIEDTSLIEKPSKQHISRKSIAKPKIMNKLNLICEICGKIFRQSSYLAHHKLQHKNDELKKQENETNDKKSIFSCEVCKKEFRKLHHLVQHRIIHNPNPVPSRTLRKSSLEQCDNKVVKEQTDIKQNEDQSAGFRCEPCDKSFRKLHHLVEHRETHDGINRQKATEVETVKSAPVHKCDICEKTFKKIQLLNEHKDQHLETCSEKSDDKSVKSCLSTKDIIHECSLCYMVFPNEHSLNKHTVICLRKKKQSAAKAKQAALKIELVDDEINTEYHKSEECDFNGKDDSLIIIEDHDIQELPAPKEFELNKDKSVEDVITMTSLKNSDPILPINSTEIISIEQKETNIVKSIKEEPVNLSTVPKENLPEKAVEEISINKEIKIPEQIQAKTKQREEQVTQKVYHKHIHKKRTPAKDKLVATVTKRQKTANVPSAVNEEIKHSAESSDDDDIRYMLNPDFKENEEQEGKNFMKVKAKKRNSLQIERPNSKDLVMRRISLQHPPKISRLKNKLLEQTPVPATSAKPTTPKIKKEVVNEQINYTDSEDSETKYAFPETIKQNTNTVPRVEKKPEKRKSVGLKRKSLNGIAKRKSLGKAIKTKHKPNPTQVKTIKKRTTEVEHRCDCGKLFSSAALLSRHTTLDHTPPRIRRRRSPAPLSDDKPVTKADIKPGKKAAMKPVKKVDITPVTKADVKSATKTATRGAKTRANERDGTAAGASGVATRNSGANRGHAHRGVPVPEKLRKAMEKSKI